MPQLFTIIVFLISVCGSGLNMNLVDGNTETANGNAESEVHTKKAIESDIKYYESLMHLSKGSKSQLPVERIKTLVQETSERKDDLEKKGSAGSNKTAPVFLEISDSKSQELQQAKTAQQVGDYFGNFAQCIQKMPLLMYTSYEAASFCRVYAYTCNNLWPENLHSEVVEGVFCIVNAYEQTTSPAELHTTQMMQRNLLTSNIIPVFDFLMTYYKYQKPAFMKTKEFKNLTTQTFAPPFEVPDYKFKRPALYSCSDSASDKLKLKCYVQNMKLIMKDANNTQPDLSKLTSQQSQQLLKKAEGITNGVTLLKQSENVWNSLLERANIAANSTSGAGLALTGHGGDHDPDPYVAQNQAMKKAAGFDPIKFIESILFPGNAGVKGPLFTSLGHHSYKNSAGQGFVGKVSKKHRFPWDHVQPGLELTQHTLVTDSPRAVCNDGSSAVIYMNEKSYTKWHFHVDGGFFCYDRPSCLMRSKLSPAQASTVGWEKTKSGSGMFDPHLGGFPDYTHGHAGYCSSDAWMGQSEMPTFEMVGGTKIYGGATGTFFHGFDITQSILIYYLKKGMGSTPGQELFVSGCSAGSIASTAMADSWPSRLTNLAARMRIKPFYPPYIWSLLDGAPVVSPPGAKKGHKTIFQYAMALAGQLYGPGKGTSPGAFLNKYCAASLPTSRAAECVWTTTVLPFIKSRNLVLVQLWDNFVTGDQFFFFTPGNHMQYDEGLNLVKMTRDVMARITPSQNYFAIGCGDHCVSDNPYFWRMVPPTAPGRYSKMSAKDLTLQTRDGLTGQLVTDTCDAYNCGCFAQSPTLTKLGLAALFWQMFENMTLVPGNMGSGTSLAIAADQTYNMAQVLSGP